MKGRRVLAAGSSRPSCTKIIYAAFFPFLLALLASLSLLRRGDIAAAPAVRRAGRGALEAHDTLPGCEDSRGCGTLSTLPAVEVAVGSTGRGTLQTLAATATAVGRGSSSSSNSLGSAHADGSSSSGEGGLEPLFLFIGILSGRGYRHRRLAVREAWATRAQMPGLVVSKFILSEDERTPQVQKELEMYHDIVFVKEKTNYKSILYKTFYVLEYGVKHYDVKFILKTDDDAFINVQPLISQLRLLCETPDCTRERLYMGKMAKHSEVLLQPGHKWNNAVFHNHTGLKVYPNYMMGGGYVMSGEVCRVLVDVHARMPLKFTPIEDATLGFWLMSMDLRHVDHARFYTWAAPCCFKAPIRKQGQRIVTRFQLAEDFDNGLCSDDPWLVLHKIDSPTKMRYVGSKVGNCSYEQFDSIPASIEAHVPQDRVLEWRQRHPSSIPQQEAAADSQAQGGAGGAATAAAAAAAASALPSAALADPSGGAGAAVDAAAASAGQALPEGAAAAGGVAEQQPTQAVGAGAVAGQVVSQEAAAAAQR
ncbi:hypothetical protein N2152v2_006285 [Parachlorella kessleri]